MALTTDLVAGSVPPQKAGATSGLSTTCSDLGISLGIAIIGSVGAAAREAFTGGLNVAAACSAVIAATAALVRLRHVPPVKAPTS
ncbi:hypothetical protein [Nonomuraea longicatena]|uniref:Uncharacterized protein n=1 Tax=Nonomuraea longicatena TaxID=83682 RepID=A0ABN1NQY9_9ACTN